MNATPGGEEQNGSTSGPPWVKLPFRMVLDPEITVGALKVYGYLRGQQWKKGKSSTVSVGCRKMSVELGLSINTVRDGVERLEQAGYIAAEQDGSKRSRYTILE